MNGFDNFNGADNFDGSRNQQVIVTKENEVVCRAQAVQIVQQKLVVIREMTKK